MLLLFLFFWKRSLNKINSNTYISVDNLEVVDAISIDLKGNAVLTISDHLKWDNVKEHLYILQSKINVYVRFIESGDIYQQYPKAEGRNIVIHVAALFEPNSDTKKLLHITGQTLQSAGYGFLFEYAK